MHSSIWSWRVPAWLCSCFSASLGMSSASPLCGMSYVSPLCGMIAVRPFCVAGVLQDRLRGMIRCHAPCLCPTCVPYVPCSVSYVLWPIDKPWYTMTLPSTWAQAWAGPMTLVLWTLSYVRRAGKLRGGKNQCRKTRGVFRPHPRNTNARTCAGLRLTRAAKLCSDIASQLSETPDTGKTVLLVST